MHDNGIEKVLKAGDKGSKLMNLKDPSARRKKRKKLLFSKFAIHIERGCFFFIFFIRNITSKMITDKIIVRVEIIIDKREFKN